MNKTGYPDKQGLYDPGFERDACGIGFIVNIKGKKSNQIVHDALTVLKNLRHRGACGCEPNTGDGAGILLQMPHAFMQAMCEGLNITLPAFGQYGVGMVFLPPETDARAKIIEEFERIIQEEGQTCLGWRAVPTNNVSLGRTARFSEPSIRQIIIGRNPSIKDEEAFERKLYVIRRRIESLVEHSDLLGREFFYLPSLSYKTIVYKGMLLSEQLEDYFLDLTDPTMESAIALVHSRFSTNTFPSWHRAHPNRYVIHNGEINTLRGNVNWMHAREALLKSDLFGKDLKKLLPIIDQTGSDSSMFDNCLEFLTLSGRSLPHVVMMMIPVPWEKHESLDAKQRAFYQFHSSLMEPWDGPASVGFSDGFQVGAVLDRNGLRPSRYYVTKDDRVILASEVGVLDIPADQILQKGRLQPGRMLLIDTREGRIVGDDELKNRMAAEHPYEDWLKNNYVPIQNLPEAKYEKLAMPKEKLLTLQHAFGYTSEDLRILMEPMSLNGVEAIGSMGDDTPLAALSDRPHLIYNYFKQLFAQVTNPPIDAFREEIVTSTTTLIGSQQNLLNPSPESCRQIELTSPVLKTSEFEKLKNIQREGFKAETFSILFNVEQGEAGLKKSLEQLFFQAEKAIKKGANILILSDRGVDVSHAPLPTLLAVAGLHHHLIRQGLRGRVSLIADSAEVREVHHFAVLLGYGVDAIHPYLAFATFEALVKQPNFQSASIDAMNSNYVKACVKGIIKIMSKMGISTVQSYRGAQIFEAVGINSEVIEKYFTRTPSRIEGIGLGVITEEILKRHRRAFPDRPVAEEENTLDVGGFYQWRQGGEHHLLSPIVIHKLQYATSRNSYSVFKEYAKLVDDQTRKLGNLRGLFEFDVLPKPIPIEEVESVEAIMKRFKTGAISYGAISREAHETLAIAMNRIGGKSNTGEGGEDPDRYTPDANGDSRNSKIKQVASGRFGVTSEYLINAEELQIKMAQGAKPGEGGQLPGKKVYPWIAKVRLSTPGVGLISPPPHHDIYSIEDLAELIHDLKNANTRARINVKLVSEVGVGTIAAGVAKAHADVILISGNDGGTGAAPQTSIKYCGLPWELGLAETHQTLVLNNLRSRVVVEVDGQLRTGRDVVIGCLLGAEEYGFSTAPLIVEGCIMMRVCHLNTCPVGVATQDPRLRKKYTGNPDHVVNYFRFVAQHTREIMAELGFRTINEMVGRADKLRKRAAPDHWKAYGVDVANILHRPSVPADVGTFNQLGQDHGLDKALDNQVLFELCKPAIEKKKKVKATVPIRNVNRVVGTIVGAEITKRYGRAGLPEDTIELHFKGSAGQSFGAFVPAGMSLYLEGDANDYLGKGLSGGKIIVTPPKKAIFKPEENIIIGNVAFYGATSGEAYIHGMAGERFCVRNSGVNAVVESIGDHGCEYMTGGRVVILGKTGRNFAAGMSGGIAYVFDEAGDLNRRLNQEMVHLEKIESELELAQVEAMIRKHAQYTGSSAAKRILANWNILSKKFARIIPKDYKRVLECIERVRERNDSATEEELAMAAFEENLKDTARVSGN